MVIELLYSEVQTMLWLEFDKCHHLNVGQMTYLFVHQSSQVLTGPGKLFLCYIRETPRLFPSKLDNMLYGTPWDTLEALKSPRVLNTHLPYKMLPKEAKEMGCKILYVLRNPKDMAVSLYNHDVGIALYEYDVECNCWFKYVREWEEEMARHPALPIQLLYFEDLKEDILQEVYKIGHFLSVENKDGLFEAVSEKCQFHNMVKDKLQYLGPEGLEFRNGFSFFRKGEVGEWKNWFTVAQNEVFDQVYNEQMKNSKHKFKYTLTETSHTSV